MTDWGVHLMDMALWAKDVTALPLSVAASGGNYAFPDRAHETFDTMSVTYQMPDHNITWNMWPELKMAPAAVTTG